MASIGILLLGLVVLFFGGEGFIKGASRLALLLGMSPLLIGLTIVAFGTSAPELGVSIKAALDGYPGIAVGNVAGSNLFNTLVILGLSAMVAPLAINRQLIRLDVPVMIGSAALMGALAWNSYFSRIEGMVLIALGVIYIFWLFNEARKDKKKSNGDFTDEKPKKEFKEIIKIVCLLVFGMVGLVMGAKWTVDGAVEIAKNFGISERIIGLTIVSAGTSLPELATSVIATLKGQRDLAVGNVVGSNILNIFLILGATAAISPMGIEVGSELRTFDIPVMLLAASLCFPFFLRQVMSRYVGAFFLGLYGLYLAFILQT